MKTILSKYKTDFKESFEKEIPTFVDVNQVNVDKTFRNYEYPISSWPIMLERERLEEIKIITEDIFPLIKKIPELYFHNDISKIASFYFGGNKMLAEFALMSCKKNEECSKRLDLVLGNSGFKILEINVGSSIGGWQVQTFEENIKNEHEILKGESLFYSTNTQEKYISFLTNVIIEKLPHLKNNTINVFFSIAGLNDENSIEDKIEYLQKLFNIYSQCEIRVFSGDPQSLKLKGSNLTLDNNTIHTVLNMDMAELPPDVHRAFFIDSIYFPDNLSSIIYGDKRNLYLLKELSQNGLFSKEDCLLIEKSIPWTYSMKDQMVKYNELEIKLKDILLEKRNEFIIKPFNGYQGRDITVGKFVDQDKWNQVIEETIKEGGYIVQEFCESIDVLAPNKQNDWKDHKLIWGSFDFGNKHCGTWVRMSESSNDNGVINSATGAVEAIVFQEK